jgi:hypothetical protein
MAARQPPAAITRVARCHRGGGLLLDGELLLELLPGDELLLEGELLLVLELLLGDELLLEGELLLVLELLLGDELELLGEREESPGRAPLASARRLDRSEPGAQSPMPCFPPPELLDALLFELCEPSRHREFPDGKPVLDDDGEDDVDEDEEDEGDEEDGDD